MSISVKDVEYLANLARIQLSPEESLRFAGQLDGILAHVEKLKSVDTENIPPTSHVLPLANVYREDKVRPSLKPEETLANAPDKEGPFFRVPKIIDAT